jgi:hypothetical protein
MNAILIAGSVIVTLALTAYTVAIVTEQRKKIISRTVLFFLTLGISLDIIATVLMIAGSPNSPFTFHGFIGYSALTVMLIETFIVWRSYVRNGLNSMLSEVAHQYSRYAYSWWVIAYITGGLLVALK